MPWEAYPEIWKTESAFMSWMYTEIGESLLGNAAKLPDIPSDMSDIIEFILECGNSFATNGGSRKFKSNENPCCLYWIHLPSHSDITTEGYVGITSNFEHRMYQHRTYVDRNGTLSKKINDSVCEIMFYGTRSYCQEIESKLRPLPYIGWNKAVGGDGGCPKHGLTGTKSKKTFYNLRTKALKLGKEFLPEFETTTEALTAFDMYYKKLLESDGVFMVVPDESPVINMHHIQKVPLKEKYRLHNRKYLVDGQFCAIVEIAEKYGVIGNNISTRLRDGWSMERIVEWLKNK